MPAIQRPNPRHAIGLACALCVVFALSAALSACSKPKLPEQDMPPDPQAAPPTTLNEAIQQPIDQAKAVRDATEDAAKEQRKAIDDATSE
jgi:hypothetical protein